MRIFVYLPIQIIDIYLTAYGGGTMYFCDKEALQESMDRSLIWSKQFRVEIYTWIENRLIKYLRTLIYLLSLFLVLLIFCK